MTSTTIEAPQEILSFDERIEILVKELELAVKWQRPCVLLVVYSSEYVRADVQAALENYLMDLGQKTIQLKVNNQGIRDIVPFLKAFKDPTRAVFLVDGLHWGDNESADAYSTLNLQKEFFVERQIRVIFWLTQKEIVSLAHYAPDFWAGRHRVIEFVDSPKAELVARQALESAWQGTGEYADQYDDTDAKITLRESLLTELPRGEEAGSIRANLLLTLGVLNWRKGDFEKADEQLQEALKFAEKIQDNWFEAECFNAIALVKTGADRTDEAIEAYKQAIRLAPDGIFAWNNLGNLCAKIGRNDEAMVAFRKAIDCNPRDPVAWNGLGNLHCKIGYVDDAIAAYRRAIQYMPTFAQPWNGLGDTYACIGRVDEAMKAYRQAIELNKKYVAPWIRLGVLFAKQDRFRDAIKAYQRALDLDSKNSWLWNELGTIYGKAESLDQAAGAFSKAIELDRGYGWAYSNLAFTYMKQGKSKETVSLLIRSIDLLQNDKDKATSWNRLAMVYRLLNDHDNAIAAYQMADSLSKESSTPNVQDIGNAMVSAAAVSEKAPQSSAELPSLTIADQPTEPDEAGPVTEISEPRILDAPVWIHGPAGQQDGQSAHQHVDTPAVPESTPVPNNEDSERIANATELQALRGAEMTNLTPSDAQKDTHSGKSATQSEAGTPAGAPAEASIDNMDAPKWNDRGNACFNRGAFEEAINAYNKAIQLDPCFGAPYSNLGLTYLTQGQCAEAILLYQKSIELLDSDKHKALSWNGLGNAYRCINDYASAVAAYQKAAELDPETAGMRDRADNFQAEQSPKTGPAWNDMGELFLKTGSIDEAIGAFRKAIELAPESGQAYDSLARALASQNKYNEAVPLFQKSIDLLQDKKDKAAVWNRLGNVFRKLNDYDNAIKAYQEAVLLADEGVDLLTRTRFSLLSNCYVNQ